MFVPPDDGHLVLVDPTWSDGGARGALSALIEADVSPTEALWLHDPKSSDDEDPPDTALMCLDYDGITLGISRADARFHLVVAQIPFGLVDEETGQSTGLEAAVAIDPRMLGLAQDPNELRALLWQLADGSLDDYQLLDLLDRAPAASPAYAALGYCLADCLGLACNLLRTVVPESCRVLVTGPLRSWPVSRAMARRLFGGGHVEVAGMGRFVRKHAYLVPGTRLETLRAIDAFLDELSRTDAEGRPNMFLFCREVADRFWSRVALHLGTTWMEQAGELHERIEGRTPGDGGRLRDDCARYLELTETKDGGITSELLRIEARLAEGRLDYPKLCRALDTMTRKVFLAQLGDDVKRLLLESFGEVVRRRWPQLSDALLEVTPRTDPSQARQVLEIVYLWMYDEEKVTSRPYASPDDASGRHQGDLREATMRDAGRALVDQWRELESHGQPWARPHDLELRVAERLSRSLANRTRIWRALGTFEDGWRLESRPIAWKGTGFPDCLGLRSTPTHEGKAASLSYYEVVAEDVRVVERWSMNAVCEAAAGAWLGIDPLGICEVPPERFESLRDIDETWLSPAYVRGNELTELAASPPAL